MALVCESESFALRAMQVVKSIESYLNQFVYVNIEYVLKSQ